MTPGRLQLVVSVRELDAMTAPGVLHNLSRAVIDAAPDEVKIDVSAVRLLDSTGVGALVSVYNVVRGYGGTLTLVGFQDAPRRVLSFAGLAELPGLTLAD